MCCFSLTESLNGNRHPATCAYGYLFCALKRKQPLSSQCSWVSLQPICLGRLGLPLLLSAQLFIYQLFAERICLSLGLQPVEVCQYRTIPSHLLILSPEQPSNLRDGCNGGDPTTVIPAWRLGVVQGGRAGGQVKRLLQSPVNYLGLLFLLIYFFRGTRSLFIKSYKNNPVFKQLLFGP